MRWIEIAIATLATALIAPLAAKEPSRDESASLDCSASGHQAPDWPDLILLVADCPTNAVSPDGGWSVALKNGVLYVSYPGGPAREIYGLGHVPIPFGSRVSVSLSPDAKHLIINNNGDLLRGSDTLIWSPNSNGIGDQYMAAANKAYAREAKCEGAGLSNTVGMGWDASGTIAYLIMRPTKSTTDSCEDQQTFAVAAVSVSDARVVAFYASEEARVAFPGSLPSQSQLEDPMPPIRQ